MTQFNQSQLAVIKRRKKMSEDDGRPPSAAPDKVINK